MYAITGDSGIVLFLPRSGVVEGENVTITNKVTSNPIEGGGSITDHAAAQPLRFDVSGIIVDLPGARETLEAMANNRDLVSYRGIESYDNLLITSLAISRAKAAGTGYTFKIVFQRITITSAAFVPVSGPTMAITDKTASTKKQSAKATQNSGGLLLGSSYSQYVAGFDSATPNNKDITAARTNPSYRGVNTTKK